VQSVPLSSSSAPALSATEDIKALKALFQWAQDIWPRMEENQRRLEAHVAELIHSRQSIVDSLHHGVIAVDLEGKINLFNRRAAELTGRRPEEVLSRPYEEVFPQHPPILRDTLRSGRPQVREFEDFPSNADTRVCYMEVTTALVRDDQGEVLGAVEVMWDLTKQREMEAQLRQARVLAALGEVAVKIAHEIRNPLGAIQLFVEMLQDEHLPPAERKDVLDGVFGGIKLMNNTISDLLQFTRPVPLATQFQNLAPHLDQALSLCEHAVRSAHVSVQREYPPIGLMCHVDAPQFVKAMLNLLLNAVQAMEEGETRVLAVRGKRRETDPDDPALAERFGGAPWIAVEVEDTGCGIARDMLERMFTPFVTTKDRGIGLGLAIVHNIVEAHGGHIRVESAVGAGTRVQLLLPVYRPSETEHPTAQANSAAG
jgi:PAS domain S-box-containing protein